MTLVEITDEASARGWLETQPHDVVVAFAARAALRSLPGLGSADDVTKKVIALPVMRAAFTSAVAAKIPISEVVAAASSTVLGASSAANSVVKSGLSTRSAANSTALSAANSARSAANSNRSAANSALSAALAARSATNSTADSTASFAAEDAAFVATTLDANGPLASANATNVFDSPLWDAVVMPEGLAKNLEALRDFLRQDPQVWGFWARWYDSFLKGKPIDWDLQEKIVLIASYEWDKGPERIAELIADLEARHNLIVMIAALTEEVATFSLRQRGIGDNDPPEPIDDVSQSPEHFEIIWEPLQALDAEAHKSSPDRTKIRQAIKMLAALLVATGKWSAGKADALVDATIKPMGVALAGAFYEWATTHGDAIAAIIHAAQDWLHLL